MADQSNTLQHPAFGARVAGGLAAAGAALSSGTKSLVKKMQYHRMVSVLNTATDKQLSDIGITRADIRRHAAYLVNYEYDGL